MATTKEEIREDTATGKFYVWKVTTSDVPGEGGAIRGQEIDAVQLTAHELAVRERIAAIKTEAAELEQKLATALAYKAQIDALQPAP